MKLHLRLLVQKRRLVRLTHSADTPVSDNLFITRYYLWSLNAMPPYYTNLGSQFIVALNRSHRLGIWVVGIASHSVLPLASLWLNFQFHPLVCHWTALLVWQEVPSHILELFEVAHQCYHMVHLHSDLLFGCKDQGTLTAEY